MHHANRKFDKPRQQRRARALDRFAVKPARADDAAYIERKSTERFALEKALGPVRSA